MKEEKRKCLSCGFDFIPGRKNQLYCKRVSFKKCLTCGKRFHEYNACAEKSRGREKKFCSQICSQKYKRPRKEYKKICAFCEEEFIAKNHNGMYCHKPDLILPCHEPECKEIRIIKNPCKEGKDKNSIVYCYKHIASQAATIQKEKNKQKNLELYGVEYFVQSEEFKKKSKETNLEKYGKEYTLQVEEVREKGKITNLKKYGVENAGGSKEAQRKIKKTFQERYGVDHYFKTDEFKEQAKETNLKKYGVENAGASEHSILKGKQTNLERYGVENPAQNEAVKEKIKETNLKKYGVSSYFLTEEFKKKNKKNNLSKYGVENFKQKNIQNYEDWINFEDFITKNSLKYNILQLMNYFNVTYKSIKLKAKVTHTERYILDFNNYSLNELKWKEKLDSIGLIAYEDYLPHNRTVINPLEIDFFLPKFNIGIEISPTWTHHYNEDKDFMRNTTKTYHYEKWKLCKQNGIELITIFDWTDEDKVIQFIKSKLNKIQTVPARKTKASFVKGLTKEHKEFLNKNHILGKIKNTKTTEVVELHYDNRLIGIGVFEIKDKYTELRRLVFDSNFRVQGGASKIIKNYLKCYPELKEIITFSDNDLGTGGVYKAVGFEVLEENKGTLIWYNGKEKKKIPNLSLVKQGTDRLLKNFPNYVPVGKGEDLPSNKEIIQQYNFLPVYDCGYTKWIYKIKR